MVRFDSAKDHSTLNEYEKAVVSFYLDNREMVATKAADCQPTIDGGSNSAVTTWDVASPFEVSLVDTGAKLFADAKGLRSVAITMRNVVADASLEANPVRCLPCVAHAMCGSCLMVLISPQIVENNADLHHWITNAAYDALRELPAYYLTEGSSVYIPLGMCPVVLGIPNNVDFTVAKPDIPKPSAASSEVRGQFTLTITPLLEPIGDLADSNTCITLSANLMKAQRGIPPSWMFEGSPFRDWRNSLQTTKAVPPAPAK